MSTIPVAGTRTWLKPSGDDNTIVNVIFDASFKAFKPLSMASWFQYYRSLTNVTGLENVDTSEVKSMGSLFRCKSGNNGNIKTLDLSTWDTSKCTDMSYMFARLSGVTTIYVSDKFVTSQVTSSDNMFDRCNSLKGGKGTKYVDGVTPKNVTYARIDGGLENPGYFTTNARAPLITSVTASDLTHESVTIEVAGDSLNDGTIKIELISGTGDSFSKTSDDFGAFDFVGLTPETEYQVKVTAESIYGTTTDETCSFATPAKPADEWKVVLDAEEGTGTVSWSEWKFEAKLAKDKTLAVGRVLEWPDAALALDFSLPVKDGEGTTYVISTLSPQFCYMKSGKAEEWVPSPCAYVGLLTLPGDGLVAIGDAAFAKCVNANGDILFPSTLTSIGQAAFDGCENLSIDGTSIPEALTYVPVYCFRDVKNLFGDIVLPNVTSVGQAAFERTGITSVSFGSGLTEIGGNSDRGAFQGCTLLTNVTFDAASEVKMAVGLAFNGCSSLEELDLRGVVNFAVSKDRNDYSHIKGCTKLKKIVFGAGLTNLMYNAMAGATALEEVVFEGVPPVGLQIPYLSAENSKGEHETGYDNRKITTYVHRKLAAVKNGAGDDAKCWNDYAANGVIGAAKKNPARNTTWAEEFVVEGVDLANRPLLTLEPDSGLLLLVR